MSSFITPSTTPRSSLADNEHAAFLETVLKAIPFSPVTPAIENATTTRTLTSPRTQASTSEEKQSLIPVSSLLNSPEDNSPRDAKVESVETSIHGTGTGVLKLAPLAELESAASPKQRPLLPSPSSFHLPPLNLAAMPFARLESTACASLARRDPVQQMGSPLEIAASHKRAREEDILAPSAQKKKRRRGPKNLKCPNLDCNVWFNQPSAVRNHIRTVHKRERRFRCPVGGCAARFGASGDVTRHVSSVHEGNRNSVCEYCGLKMSRNTVLYRHIRNIHKIEPNISRIRGAVRERRSGNAES